MTYKSPVYSVIPVPLDQIHANAWNPNSMAPPEFELLKKSIREDGYTMPIVCYKTGDDEYELVDGYHRRKAMLECKDIRERENGCLPVSLIDSKVSSRMAATIRHNRARGSHDPALMQNIVRDMIESGMSDAWIMKQIGMDADELLRMKQVSGIAALFKDRGFSRAWEPRA